ncbi:MAG TPA: ABC transporter permease, partial [Longimicrobiales bacterium]|nr:ABC transporter permease [Longimicrobiales bacterium]
MPHSDPPYRRLFRLRFLRRSLDREVEDELESHIALRVEQLAGRGMSSEEARVEAIRRLGGLEEARRRLRESARARDSALRRASAWDAVARDVTHALRRARHAPGYTALVVLSLALGIGLTTAVFTVVDGVLVRPLPLTHPDELVALWSVTEQGSAFPQVSTDNWLDWRERARSLAATGYYGETRLSVSVGGRARLVSGQQVGGEFFRTLASPVVAGRTFDEDDAQAERMVAVVSERLWRSELSAGRDLPLDLLVNGYRYQVIGVLADGTGFPAGTDVWVPHAWVRRGGANRNNVNWQAIARLRPDRTLEMADAELDRIAEAIRREDPAGIYSWGVGVFPLKDVVVGDTSEHLRLLLGAVAFVLLLTCANVAGLSVARILTRSQDVAVRVAVGAGRGQVVRHVLVEHLLLGLAGGALGAVLAVLATEQLLGRAGWLVPRAEGVSVSGTVLAFAASVSVVAGLVAAL